MKSIENLRRFELNFQIFDLAQNSKTITELILIARRKFYSNSLEVQMNSLKNLTLLLWNFGIFDLKFKVQKLYFR